MGGANEPGSLVGERLGKYEILALLALGGTAEIYLARIGGEAGFEKYVVVKCLHDHLADQTDFVDMFLDEARLGAQLDHSNIVQTLELGEHRGRYYMVMEYLSGLSLAQVARAAYDRLPGKLIPTDMVLGLAAQACAGLHYAHERTSGGQPLNIVHRDVSPQNLVVSFDGVLKIVDFGIAKAELRRTNTESGTIKGKFAYMSPEQCLAESIDRRTDIFALGTVVHELLTGQRLFKRNSTYETYQAIVQGGVPTLSSLNPQLDADVDRVVLKALAYDREDRYPSAEALGEALLGLVHKRGGSVSASDVARFFDDHFTVEIEEHADQMRQIISGKRASPVTGSWATADPDGGSASGQDSAPPRQDRITEPPPSARAASPPIPEPPPPPPAPAASPPSPARSRDNAPNLRELARDQPDEFGDEAETHIELDPMARFEDIEADVAAEAPANADRDSGPRPPSSPGAPPSEGTSSEKRTLLMGSAAAPPGDAARDRAGPNAATLFDPAARAPSAPAARAPSAPAERAASPEHAGRPGSAGGPGRAGSAPGRAASATDAAALRTGGAAPGREAHSSVPHAVALAIAFLVSAGVGLGATVLIAQLVS